MADEIKNIFQKLEEDVFSDKRLEKALEKVKTNNQFRKINYGKYLVLICGDHHSSEINLDFLEKFKKELRLNHGINCWIGNDYLKKAKGIREQDIRDAYLRDADIIVFINGKSPGTLEESNSIRNDKELKVKTMAFFKYENYEELKKFLTNKII